MTKDVWLARHPYLRPVADFHAQVTMTLHKVPRTYAVVPNWDYYVDDYRRGVPLLVSSRASIDFQPAERIIVGLLEGLLPMPIPEQFRRGIQDLHSQLHNDANAPSRAVACLLGSEEFTVESPGLLRYLGWTALAQYVCPVVDAFGKWRDDERWLRPYCPTCGSAPSIAQLISVDTSRRRYFSCGCCRTQWQFPRIGCPFCGIADDHSLCSLLIEGENALRIDYCRSCRAYLKTYIGDGSETWLLEDWNSLHLDLMAQDRGLRRNAESLYEF